MEYKPELYEVYVRINGESLIMAVNSSAILSNTDGWTQIDSGYGEKYKFAQNSYFPKNLADWHAIRRYRVAADPQKGDGHFHAYEHDGVAYGIYERTQEEMDAEWTARPVPPSDKERIKALEEELVAAKILLGLEV